MKVRKLAIALALAGGLSSGVAQALGLGEIEIRSHLNQPLNAQIDLRRTDGVSPGDITVNLASDRDYQRVGLTRDYFLTGLQFDVSTAPNGELRVVVTSREPVREPYLNFLVEVVWPSGRVMREYAVLVDPPVFADDAAGRQPVQAPAATRTTSVAQPQPGITRTQQPDSRAGATTAGRAPGTYGPTGASDTLWGIAQSVRQDSSISVQQMMLALQDLNPDAFIDGNINRLRQGQVLRIPDAEQVRQRTRAQAISEVASQNQAFADRGAAVASTAVDATDVPADRSGQAGQTVAAATGTDELRLVVADTGQQETRSDGSAGGDGRQDGSADAGRAIALEELDRIRRENDELTSRMEDLQDQVETLQRLIELKDSQLAELQSRAGQEPASAVGMPEDPEAAAGTGEPGAGQEETPASEGPADEAASGIPASVPGEAGAETADALPAELTAAEQDPATSDDPVAATGEPAAQPQPVQQPEQSFMARMIELLASNPLYQVGLGLFLILLLLLFLVISRRRAAARESEFYRQLDDEEGGDGEGGEGSFELNLDEEGAAGGDAIAEADHYMSYGQHEAAVETLENAISREPSRPDLRLKLLAVYAAAGNRESFDKQYTELEAMEVDEVMAEAEELRATLDQAGSEGFSEPVAVESDDREGSPGSAVDEDIDDLMAAFDGLDDQEETLGAGESDAGEAETDADEPIEFDLSDLDLELGLETDEPAADAGQAAEPSSAEEDDLTIDFFSSAESETAETEEAGEPEFPEDGLSFDDLEALTEGQDEPGSVDTVESLDAELAGLESSLDGEDAELDESFLDELDAELDKVVVDEDDLSDLELDVSDEDLALIDGISEAAEDDFGDGDLELGDLDLDEPLMDGELDLTGDEPAAAAADDDFAALDVPELDEAIDDADTGSDRVAGPAVSPIDELEESDLGDDEDFDFLAGTDEIATKLDLARAYVEMGDAEGAREILEEVILEGNEEQITDAQSLLKKLP